MRVAVQADIGQPVYHVGDEAIGHAARDELVARGVDVVLLTRDAEQTMAHLGPVETGRTLQFPWAPVDRERYLGEIARVLDGDHDALPPHDQVFEVIETIRGVDAVLVAGGGNLNSRFGWLMYERAAMALIADRLGKPVAITGQTLGPAVSTHDRGVLGELLDRCTMVGVRERASLDLARSLAPRHPALVAGLDDAAFWPAAALSDGAWPGAAEGSDGDADGEARRTGSDQPHIVVSLGGGTGSVPFIPAMHALAGMLDGLAAAHGARLTLLPHMATPGLGDGDEDVHRQLVAHLTTRDVEVLEVPSAAEAVRITASADLVVATRYHPAVFAAAAAVPVLALPPDHYSEVRLGGALANWGLGEWTVPLAAVVGDPVLAADVAGAVWAECERVTAHLAATAPGLREWHASWWDALVGAFAGGGPVANPPGSVAPPAALDPPDLVRAARAGADDRAALSAVAEQAEVEATRAASIAGAEVREAPMSPPGGIRRLSGLLLRVGRRVAKRAAGRGRHR